MKRCTKCKETKSLLEFWANKSKKDGKSFWCKDCMKKLKARKPKSHYIYTKDKSRHNLITSVYKTTEGEIQKMHTLQEGKCVICKVFKPTYITQGSLYVDHCHETGKIRGLLCNSCNVMLGLAKDNLLILENAISYLKFHKTEKG